MPTQALLVRGPQGGREASSTGAVCHSLAWVQVFPPLVLNCAPFTSFLALLSLSFSRGGYTYGMTSCVKWSLMPDIRCILCSNYDSSTKQAPAAPHSYQELSDVFTMKNDRVLFVLIDQQVTKKGVYPRSSIFPPVVLVRRTAGWLLGRCHWHL